MLPSIHTYRDVAILKTKPYYVVYPVLLLVYTSTYKVAVFGHVSVCLLPFSIWFMVFEIRVYIAYSICVRKKERKKNRKKTKQWQYYMLVSHPTCMLLPHIYNMHITRIALLISTSIYICRLSSHPVI